jgi:hypothetical protein
MNYSEKIKIAFYRGRYSKNIVSKLIAWFTFSMYSHVEIIIDEFSYSSRTSTKGVSKQIVDYAVEPELWDIFTVEVSEETVREIIQFFNSTDRSKYDWIGIFFYHLLPIEIEDPKKWYCSEWVARALKFQYPTLFKKIQCTPGKLFQKVQKIQHN